MLVKQNNDKVAKKLEYFLYIYLKLVYTFSLAIRSVFIQK